MAKLYIQQSYIVYRQGRNYIALYFALRLLHDDIFFKGCMQMTVEKKLVGRTREK